MPIFIDDIHPEQLVFRSEVWELYLSLAESHRDPFYHLTFAILACCYLDEVGHA